MTRLSAPSLSRREFLGAAAAGTALAAAPAGLPAAASAPRRPNMVLIMTDQQRADFFRSEGFALDTMPFIDSLSARGARFSHAYTPLPACVPARCSLLSGRFPKATRVRENSGSGNFFGPDDLVKILRAQGYSINLSGKNHSHLKAGDFDFFAPYGHDAGGRPQRRTPDQVKFDDWLKSLDHGVSLAPTPFPLELQHPHRIVDDAIECLEGRGERPFFLWVSFPEPHNPYQVPEPYFSLFPEEQIPSRVAGPEAAQRKGGKWRWMQRLIQQKRPDYDQHWRRYRADYCGMIRLIDDQLKRLVDHLQARGLLKNTILIYTSDHGDFGADYGLQRKGVGLPECLIRVPLWFAGPGIVPGRRFREELVSLVDIMPTLCEALGVEIPYGVQGRSLWPLLTGQDYPKEEFASIYAELGIGGLPYGEQERPKLHFPYEGPTFDELNSVTQSGNLKMVRRGDWKLLFDVVGLPELYNLKEDPGELQNRYEDPACRDVVRQMCEELLRWTLRTEDNLPGARYTPKPAPRNWYAPFRAVRAAEKQSGV
jgi:arylsulfatase A-like enzyme